MIRPSVFAVPPTAPPLPGDPLGAVGQDPDQVREQACKIVATSSRVCRAASTSTKPPKTYDLSWLSWLVWLLLIAGVLWVLFLVVRSLLNRGPGGGRRRQRRGRRSSDADEIELDRVVVDRTHEPVDWRAEAEGHRRAGHFRDAVRCRYRALVGDLARRGVIDEIPGRTSGEERTQLQQVRPEVAAPFAAAADLFDEAWFGHADLDMADDDHFKSLEMRVLDETPERR